MMYLNRVDLLGYVNSVEKKTLSNNNVAYNINFVTYSSFKDKNGNVKNEPEYHNIVAYNNSICDFLTKGSLCYMEGRLKYEKYETKDGVKKSVTKIIISKIVLCNKDKNNKTEENVKNNNEIEMNTDDFTFDDEIPL